MKMKTKRPFFMVLIVMALLATVTRCIDDRLFDAKGTAQIQLKLTDAPSTWNTRESALISGV
jgi:hypothetical protein